MWSFDSQLGDALLMRAILYEIAIYKVIYIHSHTLNYTMDTTYHAPTPIPIHPTSFLIKSKLDWSHIY